AGLVLIPQTPKALACSCADRSPEEKLRYADVVFTGRAIAEQDLKAGASQRSGADPIRWTFAVESVTKGTVSGQIQVQSASMEASCGVRFKLGDRYQVYAKQTGNVLSTHLCSGTQPLTTNIEQLLRRPPLPGTRVEIDGYYGSQTSIAIPGEFLYLVPKDKIFCPYKTRHRLLTDRPFLGELSPQIGHRSSNFLPDTVPWLIATVPQALQPGVDRGAELPYYARIKGYLGEPKFAACPHADRIFVVEQVVKVYAAAPDPNFFPVPFPKDYGNWPTFHEPQLGYRVPYPPDWTVEALAKRPHQFAAIALRSKERPNYPVIVRVYPPPMVGVRDFLSRGPFRQWLPPDNRDTQHLAGVSFERLLGENRRLASMHFSTRDRVYELTLAYPIGFDASQNLLNAFIVMVEKFQLDDPSQNIESSVKTHRIQWTR
ncbi:MAG: hypothetical protein WCD18_03105, partial [Thermosynechococcaceae cyanobacterium]